MHRNPFFVFFLFTVFCSCSEKAPISGTINLSSNEEWSPSVYLIKPRSLEEVGASFVGEVVDSAVIEEDGSFAFEEIPASQTPVLLQLAVQKKGERFVKRLNNEALKTSNYFPIIWKDEMQLEVTASINEFQQSFSFKNPSRENAALIKLRDIRWQAYQQFLSDSADENHDEETTKLNAQKPIMEFAQKTGYLLPALMAIRWVSPENDYERVPEFLVAQCEKWHSKMPTHPWVSQLCTKSSPEKLPILKGAMLPDFSLPLLSKDTIALHQLLGKQLTILDLWASWCAPCRKENRDFLVPLWDKYQQQGFQIIGYALDGSEQGWKKAIDMDSASRWVHASHLRGDDAPLMEELRLQTIPANLLVNGTGKVVAKNLHGKMLVQFVDDYFKKGSN